MESFLLMRSFIPRVPEPSSSTSSIMLSRSSFVSLASSSWRISFNTSVEMYPFPVKWKKKSCEIVGASLHCYVISTFKTDNVCSRFNFFFITKFLSEGIGVWSSWKNLSLDITIPTLKKVFTTSMVALW